MLAAPAKKRDLRDANVAREFYEDRFDRGYMDDWPAWRKDRIRDLLRTLDLPATGCALDFGCGTGVFTQVLHEALPEWEVWGVDVSERAIALARARHSSCRFFTADEKSQQLGRFDFIFTHHVLEHVASLPEAVHQLDLYAKPGAAMFHIMPCGNPGSLEHEICSLRVDGINPSLENRFFYEDEGHLRRATTADMTRAHRKAGFKFVYGRYANQRFGAVEWITLSRADFAWSLTDPSKARNHQARRKLWRLRMLLVPAALLRTGSWLVQRFQKKRRRRLSDWLTVLFALPVHVLFLPHHLYWKRRARQEWLISSAKENGSEMYLLFQR